MCNNKTPFKKTEEEVTPFLKKRFKKKDTHFQHFYYVVNVGVVLRVIFPLLSFIYFLLLKTQNSSIDETLFFYALFSCRWVVAREEEE